jgi:hypothetical protein
VRPASFVTVVAAASAAASATKAIRFIVNIAFLLFL